MLEAIKRWFSNVPPRSGYAEVEDWAQGRHDEFKRTREGEGFVIDAPLRAPPWRLEWGPSQRAYIVGSELRVRGDLGTAPDLQMLVVSRALMETLEGQVFEQFTEGLQTRIDTATPEEMRWLVLYPKLPVAELKGLREHVGGVSNVPQFLPEWLEGPLAAKLIEACTSWLTPQDPLVLIVQRGRLTMRTAFPRPDIARLTAALALFEVAHREARRVAEHWGSVPPQGGQSTQPSLWGREGPPTQA